MTLEEQAFLYLQHSNGNTIDLVIFDDNQKGYTMSSLKQHHPFAKLCYISNDSILQSYVITKVENRHGNKININVEGERRGIEPQETLFKTKRE